MRTLPVFYPPGLCAEFASRVVGEVNLCDAVVAGLVERCRCEGRRNGEFLGEPSGLEHGRIESVAREKTEQAREIRSSLIHGLVERETRNSILVSCSNAPESVRPSSRRSAVLTDHSDWEKGTANLTP